MATPGSPRRGSRARPEPPRRAPAAPAHGQSSWWPARRPRRRSPRVAAGSPGANLGVRPQRARNPKPWSVPVFPPYNGAQVWNAPETLEPLIEPAPPGLAEYRPRQRYLLLDERRLAQGERLPVRNLSAALFRLEASRGSDEALAIVRALVDWLADPAQTGLRRAFAVWFGRVFLPKRLPGLSFPPLNDLIEVYDMLAENVDAWTDQWEQAGMERGMQRGLERGLEQGLEQGREATRHILVRQVRLRFGAAVAEQTAPLLARVVDLPRLEELGDQLLLCADGEAWLVQARAASR